MVIDTHLIGDRTRTEYANGKEESETRRDRTKRDEMRREEKRREEKRGEERREERRQTQTQTHRRGLAWYTSWIYVDR